MFDLCILKCEFNILFSLIYSFYIFHLTIKGCLNSSKVVFIANLSVIECSFMTTAVVSAPSFIYVGYNAASNTPNQPLKIKYSPKLTKTQSALMSLISKGDIKGLVSGIEKLILDGNEIDLKFNCNNQPLVCFLVSIEKIDELRVVLDAVNQSSIDPLTLIEDPHFKVSDVFSKLLFPIDKIPTKNKVAVINHLIKIGVNVVEPNSDLVSPLPMLLGHQLDGESELRQNLITQLSLVDCGLKETKVKDEPLVIHMANNIGKFSPNVIKDLKNLGVDFSVKHNGHDFHSILKKLFERRQIDLDDYAEYVMATGEETKDPLLASFQSLKQAVQPISETEPKSETKTKHKRMYFRCDLHFHFSKNTKRKHKAEQHKQRIEATNLLATQAIVLDRPSKEGLSRSTSDLRTVGLQDKPKKKPSKHVSHQPYLWIKVKSQALKRFGDTRDDEIGLTQNRAHMPVDCLWQEQDGIEKQIKIFEPVIYVSEKDKQNARKKFKLGEKAHKKRLDARLKSKAIGVYKHKQNHIKGRRRLSTTPSPLPSPGVETKPPRQLAYLDDVFSDELTEQQMREAYDSARRRSIESSTDDAAPLLKEMNATAEATDLRLLTEACKKSKSGDLFLPMLTSQEAKQHEQHQSKLLKVGEAEVVEVFKQALERGESARKKWKQATRVVEVNASLERWHSAVEKVLQKTQTTREHISGQAAAWDSDFSEKLEQAKYDQHISHGASAALTSLKTAGHILQLVNIYQQWNTEDCIEKLNRASELGGVALGVASGGAETASHLVTDLAESFHFVSDVASGIDSLQKGVVGVVNTLKELKNSKLINRVTDDSGEHFNYAEDYFTEGEAFSTNIVSIAKGLGEAASSLFEVLNRESMMLEKMTPALGLCLYCLDLSRRTLKLGHDIHDYCRMSEIKQRLKLCLPDFPVIHQLVDCDGKTLEKNLHAVVFGGSTLGEAYIDNHELAFAKRFFVVREIKDVNGKRINRQVFEIAMDGLSIGAEIVVLTGLLSPVALGLAGSVIAAKASATGFRMAKQEFHDFMNSQKSRSYKKKERIEVAMTLIKQLESVLIDGRGLDEPANDDFFVTQLIELDICFTAAGLPLNEFIKAAQENGLTEAAEALYAAFEARE